MTVEQDFSTIISDQADRQFKELVERSNAAAAGLGPWQPALWESMEASGLALALVPEDQEGAGLDARDALEIVRLSGYRGLPLPLAETLLARALWATAGGDRTLWGESPTVLAPGLQGQPLRLHQEGETYCISGATEAVSFGAVAACILLQAQSAEGQHYLVLIEAAQIPRQLRVSASFEQRHAFHCNAVPVPADRCVPWPVDAAPALYAQGALLRSMQMLGAMQRCVELGLQYATERVQFGRPISRFAPVQDMLVEASAELAAALAAAGLAVARWQAQPTQESMFCMASAKSRCGEAAGKVSALIHQVHGAIGFTQEHSLHQFTRRLWAWRDDFGSETFWNQWIGKQVCAASGGALWQSLAKL